MSFNFEYRYRIWASKAAEGVSAVLYLGLKCYYDLSPCRGFGFPRGFIRGCNAIRQAIQGTSPGGWVITHTVTCDNHNIPSSLLAKLSFFVFFTLGSRLSRKTYSTRLITLLFLYVCLKIKLDFKLIKLWLCLLVLVVMFFPLLLMAHILYSKIKSQLALLLFVQ